jgi:RHS repeat-associated protein
VGLGGLYDYGARHYDAATGRFVSADTIVPDFSNPQSLNRYAYVYNNPLWATDPSGHCPALIGAGVGALFGLGAYALTTDSFDLGEALLVTGAMAGAGALIGTGVGIAAGAQLASATLVGAGVGAAAGGGSEMLANAITDSEFSSTEFVISTAGGALSGAATAMIPGVGLAPAATRSMASGSIGVGQYGVEQALTSQPLTLQGAMVAFSGAAVGQMLGESVSVAAVGTPSAREAMTRVRLSDFNLQSAESGFSPIFYKSYPFAKEYLQGATAVRAVGEVFRDVGINVALEAIAY